MIYFPNLQQGEIKYSRGGDVSNTEKLRRILKRGREYSEMARISRNQDLQGMADYQSGVKFGLFLAAQNIANGRGCDPAHAEEAVNVCEG